jgi:hypothetical protein
MLSLVYHGDFSEIRLIPFVFLLAAVNSAARLLNCSAQDLMLALSSHKIQAGKDSIAKKLTMQQACLVLHLKTNLPTRYPKSTVYSPVIHGFLRVPYRFLFRLLIEEMHCQSLSMQTCLSGLWYK